MGDPANKRHGPSYLSQLTRNFVSILADLEPIDVRVLDDIYKDNVGSAHAPNTFFRLASVQQTLSLAQRDCENSVRNLFRLGLLKPGVVEVDGVSLGGFKPTIYKDTEVFDMTHLGEDFYKAVTL